MFHLHVRSHVVFFSLAVTRCPCLRRSIEADAHADILVVNTAFEQLVDNATQQLTQIEKDIEENSSSLHSFFSPAEHQVLGDTAYQKFFIEVQTEEEYRELHEQKSIYRGIKETLGLLVKQTPRQWGQLSFGDLVFLAGDFFSGEIDQPGVKLQKQPAGALESIKDHMFGGTKKQKKVNSLLGYIDNMVLKGLDKQDGSFYRNFWFAKYRGAKEYLQLAKTNSNHFGGPTPPGGIAFQEYKQIHAAALELSKGGQLLEALELEGTAGHYLSDLFAAGHIRTPREELQRDCSGGLGASDGEKIIVSMHDEDGFLGLSIKSKAVRTPWKAYGDGLYSMKDNADNREQVVNAIKTGILEVFRTFLFKAVPMYRSRSEKLIVNTIASHIPFPTGTWPSGLNHPPLAKVDDGVLKGRVTPATSKLIKYKVIQKKCRAFLGEFCITCKAFAKKTIKARNLATKSFSNQGGFGQSHSAPLPELHSSQLEALDLVS